MLKKDKVTTMKNKKSILMRAVIISVAAVLVIGSILIPFVNQF